MAFRSTSTNSVRIVRRLLLGQGAIHTFFAVSCWCSSLLLLMKVTRSIFNPLILQYPCQSHRTQTRRTQTSPQDQAQGLLRHHSRTQGVPGSSDWRSSWKRRYPGFSGPRCRLQTWNGENHYHHHVLMCRPWRRAAAHVRFFGILLLTSLSFQIFRRRPWNRHLLLPDNAPKDFVHVFTFANNRATAAGTIVDPSQRTFTQVLKTDWLVDEAGIVASIKAIPSSTVHWMLVITSHHLKDLDPLS